MTKKLIQASAARLGLRERKKQETRETIAHAALRLFSERGYEETTLPEIAEAANVAPRTIFAYYESKEDIVLCDESHMLERLRQVLDERPPGTTTVDALRGLLSSLEPPGEHGLLRKRVIAASPALRIKLGACHAQIEPLLAASIAKDLGTEADDIRAILAAASVTAAFTSVRDRFFESESAAAPTREQGMAVLDDVLEFLRGGLEAMRRPG